MGSRQAGGGGAGRRRRRLQALERAAQRAGVEGAAEEPVPRRLRPQVRIGLRIGRFGELLRSPFRNQGEGGILGLPGGAVPTNPVRGRQAPPARREEDFPS